MIKPNDKIIEIDSGKELKVEFLWGNASNIIDFSARYQHHSIDQYGNKVYPSRGFRFEDEDKKWRKSE